MNSGIDSLETKVSRFLFSNRITPQPTTGQSPAELLFNRQLRSAFTLIKPDTTNAMRLKQSNNEYYSKRNKPLRYFIYLFIYLFTSLFTVDIDVSQS